MTDRYNNILIAVDGSEQSEEALNEAIAIAKRNGAKLTVLTVLDVAMFSADPHAVSQVVDQAEISAKNILKEAEHIISGAVDYEVFSLSGNPKALIADFAREQKADLLVVGATGKGAITRLLIGSTTAYVVNNAPCNVLVVK